MVCIRLEFMKATVLRIDINSVCSLSNTELTRVVYQWFVRLKQKWSGKEHYCARLVLISQLRQLVLWLSENKFLSRLSRYEASVIRRTMSQRLQWDSHFVETKPTSAAEYNN